jgi:hypothetical protein
MGAWAEGLYDNDRALDALGDLLDGLDPDAGPCALATVIGLRVWLHAPAPSQEELVELLDRRRDWLSTLPAGARRALEELEREKNALRRGRARTPAVAGVLGTYCDGPRYETLLAVPGSEVIVAELAKEAAERLDAALEDASDLYEASVAGAHLGVLLELSSAGYWSAAREPIARWGQAVDRIDAETKEEREFWDEYVSRLRRGLALLEKA